MIFNSIFDQFNWEPILFWAIIYQFVWWAIFKQAGKSGWISLIPLYRDFVLLSITKISKVLYILLVLFTCIVFATTSLINLLWTPLEDGHIIYQIITYGGYFFQGIVITANIIFFWVILFKLARSFNKSIGFSLLMIPLWPILLIILALPGIAIQLAETKHVLPVITAITSYCCVIVFGGILLYGEIILPQFLEWKKEYQYGFIKEKLIDIRSAQLAFKEKNNLFTNDFNQLIEFVKKDSFVIIQKTDTLIEFYNKDYREYQFKDTLLIDTLAKISVLDSLFSPTYPIDSLSYVPFGDGAEFKLRAGTINKAKIIVPVFEASDPNPLDKTQPLVIGSLIEAHVNGNWQ